jgi:ribosomal protein S18 acetylase RimI-like enzyme
VAAKPQRLKTEPVLVRRLRKGDDLRGLLMLSRQFFREYSIHHRELLAVTRLQQKHVADYFAKFTTSDDAAAFAAYAGDRPIGYVTVSTKPQPPFNRVKKVGVVSGLMVAKACRRRGIALRLISRVNRFLRQRRVKYFTVYTAVTNAAALLFYSRIGMTPYQLTMVGTARVSTSRSRREKETRSGMVRTRVAENRTRQARGNR